MPNGDDKNWMRFCSLVDDFRAKYRHWPKRVYLPAIIYDNVTGDILSPIGLALVASIVEVRVELQSKKIDALSAEGEDGERVKYGSGAEGERPTPRTSDFFGEAIFRHGLEEPRPLQG
jgi:hypothetical protein